MGLNLPDLYGSWTQARDNGRQRVLGEQIQQTMPDAIGGKADAMKRLMGLDPRAGMEVQNYVSGQQKSQQDAQAALHKDLGMTAAQVVRAAQGGDPAALQGTYAALVQKARQMDPNADLPDQFDPNDLPHIHQLVALGGGDSSGPEGRVVGDALVNPFNGQVMYQSAPKPIWDSERGGFVTPPSPYAPQSAAMPAPTTGGGGQMLSDAVMSVESGGNPNAVSPKGAVGTMQTMPGTLRDPGFGVMPARDNSPAEQERVGKDYLGAMIGKYGREGGLAAYNWGPGNWEAALQRAGGDPQRALQSAPAETRAYVPKVLGRTQRGPQGASAAGFIPVPGIGPKAKKEVRMLTPAEVRQYGYRPGSVVQMDSEGKHQVVQAPPESKDASVGRPLPVNAVNKLTESAGRLQNLNDLADGFNEGYAGHTVLGDMSNTAGRLGFGDKDQAEWWQRYDRMKNEVRNKLFGASLTDSERKAFESTDITPAMSPEVIRKNLATQRMLIQRALQREGSVWSKQGYSRDAIEAAIGVPMDQAPAAPKHGKYSVGQVINHGGKRYRITGGDMNDPDVEEVH